MGVNIVNKTKKGFITFLQQVSRDPISTIDDINGEASHTTIHIGREGQSPSSSFHIVSDNDVYRNLINLPRADYIRDILNADGIPRLLTADHKEHLERKRKVVTQFRRNKVMESTAVMSSVVNMEMDQMREEGKVNPFSMAQAVNARYFLKFAFNKTSSKSEEHVLSQASMISNELKLLIATNPHHISCLKPHVEEGVINFLSDEDKKTMSLKEEWIKTIVIQRIKNDTGEPLTEKSKDLLDILLMQSISLQGGNDKERSLGAQLESLDEAKQKIVVKQTAKDVSSFITAAIETTPTMIAYAMYTLAHNQDKQDALRQEIKNAGSEIRMGDILNAHILMDKNKMPVLNDVLSSSLREYPPAKFSFPRQIDSDVEVNGIAFERGDIVLFDLAKLEQYFHAGQYICPGKSMAEMEASMTLAMVIDNFKLEPIEGTSIPPVKPNSTVSVPSKDVPLRVLAL